MRIRHLLVIVFVFALMFWALTYPMVLVLLPGPLWLLFFSGLLHVSTEWVYDPNSRAYLGRMRWTVEAAGCLVILVCGVASLVLAVGSVVGLYFLSNAAHLSR